MRIEAGKFYKTRDGRKVGPMIVGKHCNYVDEKIAQAPDNECWFLNGRKNNLVSMSTDIVSLWDEGPVREVTVTRREIVEGQYGGIYVMPDGPGRVTLGFDGFYTTFNAEQLAELEHLSAQLREALEDA